MRITFLLSLVGLAIAASSAHADVQWLCSPTQASDPCRGDLTTRVYAPDGTSSVVAAKPAADPKIDCFYVYPTVSNQPTTNATKAADPEVQSIARFQAQRFSSECRVFAPLYRQVTAAGVTTASQTMNAEPYEIGLEDVREAFRQYLRDDNQGRGFVLLGHSQGSRILRAIIRDEIDKAPAVRARMLSAIIPGANANVGEFANVPACASGEQIHCVISYSTFNETPPANARFGRTDTDPVGSALDLPRGEVQCSDPAVLSGRAGQPLESFLPSAPFAPGVISVLLTRLYGGAPPTSPDTPWLTPTDRYTSACVRDDGANVLRITPAGPVRKLTPSPDATWGVHLVDLNLPLGDLLRIVGREVETYTRAAPRALSAKLLAAKAGRGQRLLTATVKGPAGTGLRVTLLRGGKVVVRRSVKLGAAGIGRVRFRVRRPGSYAVVVRDGAGKRVRSSGKVLTLR